MTTVTTTSKKVQQLQYKLYNSKYLDPQAYKQLVSYEFKHPFSDVELQTIYRYVLNIVSQSNKICTYYNLFGNTMHMATSMRTKYIRIVVGIC